MNSPVHTGTSTTQPTLELLDEFEWCALAVENASSKTFARASAEIYEQETGVPVHERNEVRRQLEATKASEIVVEPTTPSASDWIRALLGEDAEL